MTKAEYRKLNHDIRTISRSYAAMQAELTGKKHTTRSIIHNVQYTTLCILTNQKKTEKC